MSAISHGVFSRWTKLGQPTRGGHRYFRDAGTAVAVADNSGHDPSSTDDGPLWLDAHRKVVVEPLSSGSQILACLPVTAARHKKGEFWVSVPIQDLVWLLEQGFWNANQVELRGEASVMANLVGVILKSAGNL
jgi:hypothetical protein